MALPEGGGGTCWARGRPGGGPGPGGGTGGTRWGSRGLARGREPEVEEGGAEEGCVPTVGMCVPMFLLKIPLLQK